MDTQATTKNETISGSVLNHNHNSLEGNNGIPKYIFQEHIDKINTLDIEYEDTKIIEILDLPHEVTELPIKGRKSFMTAYHTWIVKEKQ